MTRRSNGRLTRDDLGRDEPAKDPNQVRKPDQNPGATPDTDQE